MKKQCLFLLVFAASLAIAGNVRAATTSGSLNVSGQVVSGCIVKIGQHLDFGTLTPGQGLASTNGNVQVLCPLNVAYRLGARAGQHYGTYPGAGSERAMAFNGYYIPYQIVRHDPLCPHGGCVWGDQGMTGGDTYPIGPIHAVGTGDWQTTTFHAGFPALPTDLPDGFYLDVVEIVAEW